VPAADPDLAPGADCVRRPAAWGWLLLVALTGGAILVVELAAVRLLAPWFGTSAGVWTNVIGVILLGLALGYLLGARLAARARPERRLGWVLVLAGLTATWTPFLTHPICTAFLPAGLSLHQAAGLWLWGSLAATLLLFLPSTVLLGCVGPLALEILAVRRGGHAGTAGGQVLCASTLGSLLGTFATTHVLIPEVGLTRSFLGAGLLLCVLGLVCLWGSSRGGDHQTVWLLGAMALGSTGSASQVGRLRLPDLPHGMREVARQESSYQSLRVVDDDSFGAPLRLLQVNEGLDSFQSVWRAETGLLGQGFYYDAFVLPAWLSRDEGPWKTLVLGLGAGTAFRVLAGALPPGLSPELWGVEIDPAVVELGRKYFDLTSDPASGIVVSGQDARLALRHVPRDFDCIVLDAYANQVEIPAHLCTLEFFDQARAHMAEGGWLVVNAGGFGSDDPVLVALGSTIARAFGTCLAVRVPRARNWVLFARRDGELPRPSATGACTGPGWEVQGQIPRSLLAPLSLPGSAVWFEDRADRPVLTDDLNPMETLQRRSLAEGQERLGADV
jgi:spermidine synthase